ncbi:hypothetical protein [Asanoa iriomotensis]|uniref:Uncharacterized protein n=1 Tax=Asanoa iriomotensis TaxID=234613 RepID=A0ABQ4C116_9ACTN|nr:hypothetical protein [Asanoa iriomotensis]GIF56454.1 hypothetical protein Air01nite_25490 [Asanoa iriomotensis]
MDRDRLLQTISDLDDPAEVSRLVAEALLGLGAPGDDPLDADLVRRLGEEQIQLGHSARGLDLLEIAVTWAPDRSNLSARRVALLDRAEDGRAVAEASALLPAEAARWELSQLYQELGLPAHALDVSRGRSRLRLWWATGGPLWFVRRALRRREAEGLAGRLVVGDAPGPLEPLLRGVCADVGRDRTAWQLVMRADQLVRDGDAPAAARLLAAPVAAGDAHPRLIATAVDIADDLSDSRLALQLSDRLDPLVAGLHRRRAGLLVELDRLRDAWTLLDTGTLVEELREVRAKILLSVGLAFLAVDAHGPAGVARSEWRRRWWRTGGPLWFVRDRGRRREEQVLLDWLGPHRPAIGEPAADALGRAADAGAAVAAAGAQENRDAAGTLAAAYHPDRPSVPLLERLGWALYFDNQEELALLRIREARSLEPAKASLLQAELTFLNWLGRYVEASAVSDRYAEGGGRPAEARAARGDLLDDLGFYALSLEAFGPADGLGSFARTLRWKQWWRTGGPLVRIRRALGASDRWALDLWKRRCADTARTLGAVVGPERVAELRAAPDRFAFQETRWELRWGRIRVVAHRVATYAGAIVSGYVVARLAGDLGALWSAAVGFACAAIVVGALWRVDERTRLLPAMVAVAASGYLVTRIDGRWPLLVGATVLAVVAVSALRLIAVAGANVGGAVQARRVQRADPRGFAVVGLLEVLAEVERPTLRNDLHWRRYKLRTLEQVASRLETDLPAVFAADPASAEVLRHRGRRAAAALRELKYLMVAAPPGAWRKIEETLRKDIAALATGALGRLQAADPPERQVRHRSRRQIVADGVRMLFFAGLPLAVVLVAQPWLRFNETILNWARLLTIGWAVLYVLLTVDPTFRDKLRTGFALINLGRGTGDPAQLEPSTAEKRANPAK